MPAFNVRSTRLLFVAWGVAWSCVAALTFLAAGHDGTLTSLQWPYTLALMVSACGVQLALGWATKLHRGRHGIVCDCEASTLVRIYPQESSSRLPFLWALRTS